MFSRARSSEAGTENSGKGTITRRLVISFSSLIVIYFFFGLYSLFDIHTITGLTRTIYDHPLVVSNAALRSNVAITKMHRDMKDVVLFTSPTHIQRAIDDMNRQERLVYHYLDIVRDNILGDEECSLFLEMAGDIAYALNFNRMEADRALSERKRQTLEHQLLQAQKMESIGRLAGGVAHDYNNMLSVIIGNTELAMEKIAPEESLHGDLEEVLAAARRSAEITKQLLAFARQQTIAPEVLDLNATVEGMLKMLRRLIGENLDFSWQPENDLWPIKIDPSQINQILANLCVNARDAIKDVGKVTIETQNVSFDEDYCADHAGFIPGDDVMLAVSDNGSGMAPETLDKVFEPFFTTKGLGQGTGLGLATVYGIVKQNNGFINIYSEPEQGTTIKTYLPRHSGEAVRVHRESPADIPLGQGETVLLVEDEGSILKLAQTILEKLGYTVLSASAPGEAINLAAAHAGDIDLLITDVVMPEMNGRELSTHLNTLYPEIGTLYMSGYTANVIAHRGVLDEGVSFIPKPLSIKNLAVKVREVLDGDPA